jgi:superfamily II helicase
MIMATQKVQLCQDEECNNRAYAKCSVSNYEYTHVQMFLCERCMHEYVAGGISLRFYDSDRCKTVGDLTKSARKK